ncbi:BTB/POZ domain-containing protein At3g22104 isoform X2 [Hevea brasiliensis]|nr:BTB/POZ domain-containing protein At3g22104 isoform X2 [Hevea brasiliensis]
MEMGSNSSATTNLVDQTEKSLRGINHWTWSELLVALKQCQDLFPAANSSFVLDKLLDSLIGRVALPTVASPFRCSSENFSCQFSSDISSTCSTRNNCSPASWWFEGLLFLNIILLDKVIRMMASQKLDHASIFKFLIFYLKARLLSTGLAEKRQIMEKVISLLLLLDRSCLSCKGLFDVLRIVSSLKRISKCYKIKLERLISSQLDQATLDHLLVPSPPRKHYMYDVNLVLRLAEAYLRQGWMTPSQLKKVGSLMDSYLVEVAPDFLLKPSAFGALVSVLPDSARESGDRLYQAVDLYLEVHTQLCEEEKMRLCCGLNHEKLSAETLQHLAQNSKFPSSTSSEVFIGQQSKHSSSISNYLYSLKRVDEIRFCSSTNKNMSCGEDTKEPVLPFERKHEHSRETGMHLQRRQRRVAELEKLCPVMQPQMPNVTKRRLCNSGKVRSLPKLCS